MSDSQETGTAPEALPKEVIILLCILGAAALTTVAYAIYRVFNPALFTTERFFNNVSEEQAQYLREVKQRNMDAMGMSRWREKEERQQMRGGRHYGHHGHQSETPSYGRTSKKHNAPSQLPAPAPTSYPRRPSWPLFIRPTRIRRWAFIAVMLAFTIALLYLTSFSGFHIRVHAQSSNSNAAVAGNYSGAYRPQVHFSPPKGFMNDPNGMFQDSSGIWHYYYQLNPTDTIAGNQHWGHATSPDLYHWTNQAIALAPYSNVTGIFTGSAVIDVNNTSGFFPNQTNGVVAMFTANGDGEQEQAIAYSRDDGYTWTLYEGNPVIAIGSKNFRDPKVIWHRETENWVMVLAFATEFAVGVYTSPDLTSWTHTSNFSYAGILGLQYECPNLVQMPFKTTNTSTGQTTFISAVWLMYISINPGAPLGGSVGQYFAGDFNGTHFTPFDNVARLADFGKDNYATQFFYRDNDDGSKDAVSMAWASNWQYTNYVPTGPTENWQSAATLPRRNWITNSTELRLGYILASYPYDIDVVLGRELGSSANLVNNSLTANAKASNTTGAFLISANVTGLNTTGLANTASLNITISSSATGEKLTSGQNFGGDPNFWMDRSKTTAFDNVFFTDKVSTGLVLQQNWSMLMVVDRSVWEVFLAGGERSATQTYFAKGMLDQVEVAVQGLNEASVVSVKVWELRSAWQELEDGMGIVKGNGSIVRKNGLDW